MSDVSVVIPCRNGAPYLRDAIASAFAQTDPPLEVIVVDDASSDDSAAIAAAAGARVVRSDGTGPGFARNTGVAAARAGWLQFLDADDYLMPDKLARQLAVVGDADGAYSDFARRMRGERRQVVTLAAPVAAIVQAGFGGAQPDAFLLRRRVFDRVAWPTEPVYQHGLNDTKFFADCVRAGVTFRYVPGVMSVFRAEWSPTQLGSNPERWRAIEHYRAFDSLEARPATGGT